MGLFKLKIKLSGMLIERSQNIQATQVGEADNMYVFQIKFRWMASEIAIFGVTFFPSAIPGFPSPTFFGILLKIFFVNDEASVTDVGKGTQIHGTKEKVRISKVSIWLKRLYSSDRSTTM